METDNIFNSVAEFIRESRELLKGGVMMDMKGLDKRVMALCEQALMLPPDVRAAYADKLQGLMDDLSALSIDLETRRDALAGEIRGIAEHKKAHTAYSIVETSDKKESEES